MTDPAEAPAGQAGPAPRAGKPIPLPDDVTAGYWEAARRHVLAVQFCAACERFIHLPELCCPHCGSEELHYREVSGRGTVDSFTVMHDSPGPGFADRLPYLAAAVELEEQPRLLVLANLTDVGPDDVRIGLPVEVVFEQLTDDCALPQFRPRGV
ncbi:OB-fold domain-containing protein [Yinghuangia sp. ASG 101]|uniref:Zn-ribbon domain-containing OB-fold protein n=1 Tax=Yinghuangia sp. ASG 101 TaxID=2896848 RepID=UPI001E5B41E2|nr:OB-fold domain-containing protein [Yinghuangia sp. ASG 101]UGQ11594.1 OB-fold domain-containing protein [Yinghuangia sp. ASG 101]